MTDRADDDHADEGAREQADTTAAATSDRPGLGVHEVIPADVAEELIDHVRQAIERLETELAQLQEQIDAATTMREESVGRQQTLTSTAEDLIRMANSLREDADTYRQRVLEDARIEAAAILDAAAGESPTPG